ncbi:AIPR family protein [Lentzea sp. CC55]|uniref:AIPR family protein n=1 Tax=Lentzea sp. CC55 TaxID=2884909 RepID=UPI0027DFFDCC|nr:AIPR family protein [Lentzea sp. CC55]MCG8924360.1 AIPR family protein [Lentzea sp. CC55]
MDNQQRTVAKGDDDERLSCHGLDASIRLAWPEQEEQQVAEMPLQVRHVRDALRRDFADLIDLSDLESRPEAEQEQAFLSRALTAIALQDMTGVSAADAASGVIDGMDDQGIDGVAVAPNSQRLWLVQTKWSDKGKASLDQAATLKLHRGIKLLLDGDYDQFNARFQKLAGQVSSAIDTPGVRITLVIALMGPPVVAQLIKEDIKRMLVEFNSLEELVDVQILGFPDFYRLIRAGVAEAKADMEAVLESWGTLEDPYRAYYGTMPVTHVAAWYADHGEKLFSQNIRRSLGLTEVNNRIRSTLLENPEHFWYFNNGITVLCDTIKKSARDSTTKTGKFLLTGASVVNGAQTVQSIHAAVSQQSEESADGRVWVRLISLEKCPEHFDKSITEATNTQNRVEARDFVALDQTQRQLRDDFMLSLQKIYVIKRGEPDPDPAAGCSVVEAARALACANSDPTFAARAKNDSAVLWETGPKGTYTSLFGHQPNAFAVWRSVELLRVVRDQVQVDSDERDGRAAKITEHADMLTAHLVFRQLTLDRMDDPAYDWDAELREVPQLTTTTLDWIVHHVNVIHGSGFVPSIFRSAEQCSILAERVLFDLRNGRTAPDLSDDRQTRGRRTNAVIVLVDSGRLENGTVLHFQAGTTPEQKALDPWLAEDPRRSKATWVNNRGAPLLWEADGNRYSPSGLTKHMIRQVGLKTKAVQGTSRWYVPGEGSLVQLADQVRDDDSPSSGL